VLVAYSWTDRDGGRQRWAHLLKLKDGKIVDMQDYASLTRAMATARLLAFA
jgi:hypothetical protein